MHSKVARCPTTSHKCEEDNLFGFPLVARGDDEHDVFADAQTMCKWFELNVSFLLRMEDVSQLNHWFNHSLWWCEIAKWKTVPSMLYRRQIFAFNAIFPFIPDRIWATSLRRNRWPNQRSTDGPSVRTWREMRHNELKRNEIQKRFIGRIDAFDGGVSKSTQTSYGSNGINGKLIPPGIENGKNMNLFASFDERCELRGEQKDVCRSFSSCRHGSERTNDKF